jgi:MSHA biogenesis protein MshN
MSLINKMLQDLDKRHAAPGAGYSGPAGSLAQQLRPVKARGVSEWFWYAMGLLMIVSVAWVGWFAWQLWPRPIVTELAYQSGKTGAPRPLPADKAAAPASPKSAVDAKTAANLAAPAQASASTAAAKAAASPGSSGTTPGFDAARPDMLRLATELTTPIAERKRPAAKDPRKSPKSGTVGQTLGALPAPPEGGIDRRASSTARDRANAEFHRAINLINQGRMAEGLGGLRNALKFDPEYEAVRRTLVALLVEAKRIDEAAAVLQEGLALDPGQTPLAMLLARLLVERNNVAGALALLQKHAPASSTNADYHAFAAALYQRLGRHENAIDEYQTALKLAPAAGVWWIGLGISQQALNRPKDALDAFQRAQASPNLAPELVAYADRRVKLLR